MAPELLIALGSLALAAATLAYTGWRDRNRIKFDQELLERELHESRARELRVVAYENLRALDGNLREAGSLSLMELGWLAAGKDPQQVLTDAERRSEELQLARDAASWFKHLGWTREIRDCAAALVAALDDVARPLKGMIQGLYLAATPVRAVPEEWRSDFAERLGVELFAARDVYGSALDRAEALVQDLERLLRET
jgi:hypothetical protein